MPTPNKLAAVVNSNSGSLSGFTRPSVKACLNERDARRTAQANFGVAKYPNRQGDSFLYVAAYSGETRVETSRVAPDWCRELGELRFYWV